MQQGSWQRSKHVINFFHSLFPIFDHVDGNFCDTRWNTYAELYRIKMSKEKRKYIGTYVRIGTRILCMPYVLKLFDNFQIYRLFKLPRLRSCRRRHRGYPNGDNHRLTYAKQLHGVKNFHLYIWRTTGRTKVQPRWRIRVKQVIFLRLTSETFKRSIMRIRERFFLSEYRILR